MLSYKPMFALGEDEYEGDTNIGAAVAGEFTWRLDAK